MLQLNKDVLSLILEEFKDDIKTLYLCLFVNRTWCQTTLPILWRTPGQNCPTDNVKYKLFNVIISHLSKESREILKNREIDLFTETYQRPLFNYINFWRYLNLYLLENMISLIASKRKIEEPNISLLRSEMLKLFINSNTKFTGIYIPQQYNYQIHLVSGAEHCLSELKCLHCSASTDQTILEGLSGISKSIKKLICDIKQYDNHFGIVKLIETQKNLNDVCFTCFSSISDESYCENLEKSLIKNAGTIQHLRIDWKPITKFLSYLVNLVSLNVNLGLLNNVPNKNWNHLEDVSLPVLKILRAQQVPSEILAGLIENTKGFLTEISISFEGHDNRRFIQAIYNHCPNLKQLKLLLYNDNFSELEKLLINCRYLNELVVITDTLEEPDWDDLFKILTKSSPISLFNFKFSYIETLKLESLKFFLDNWKGRNPMLLAVTNPMFNALPIEKYSDLVERYKAKGVVQKYEVKFYGLFC